MSTERYDRLSRIFLEACDLPAPQRAPYLDAACTGDQALRAEVDAMLAAEAGGASLLDRSVLDAAAPGRSGHDAADILPERIGDYRVLEVLGRGGMAIVYLAEQDNPRRRVALKVIRPGVAGTSGLQRFRHEAVVLARLQHPGIAQIYEAGTFNDGGAPRPFFAMEHIKGLPADVYVRESALDTRSILELLARICDAVHHAHQQGVIHRDLKPGNILIDPSGQPKVLDFGVARATDADLNVRTVETTVGQLVGTIPYMSPEQIAGDPHDIDTRSDVFALGVIAYQFLTGRLPHDVRRTSMIDAVRRIRETAPPPLSSIDRTLRGDVQTIVATALEKDKSRRYQSAADLARDIRHYLAHEPISARPPTAFYQFRKFARRNRALVTAGAVAALSLAATSIITTIFWRLSIADRLRADQRATQLETAVDFLRRNVLESALPWRDGPDATVLEALAGAVGEIDELFADQPYTEGLLRHSVGNIYAELGHLDQAERQLRRAVDRLRDESPESARTLNAQTWLAELLRKQGKLAEAQTLILATIDAWRETLGDDAAFDAERRAARIFLDAGDHQQAAEMLTRALRSSARRFGPASWEVAAVVGDLVVLRSRQQGSCTLRAACEEATSRLAEDLGAPPADPMQLAFTVACTASSQRYRWTAVDTTVDGPGRTDHDLDRTESFWTELVSATEPHSADEAGEYGRSNMLHALADTFRRRAKFPEAVAAFQEALEIRTAALGADHLVTCWSRVWLGRTLTDLGRYDEARQQLAAALPVYRRVYGDGHAETQAVEKDLARLTARSEGS